MRIECDICKQSFDISDPYIRIAKDRHELWHKNAWKDKRNTAQGIVNWVDKI